MKRIGVLVLAVSLAAGCSTGGGTAESAKTGGTFAGADGASSTGGTSVTGGISANGGASAIGGSTATGGTVATGGATSSGPCAVQPATPNATAQAKSLLCYLYSLNGNHVLSGQQETSWSNPAGDISFYPANGMKTPAVLGGDFLYADGGGATAQTTTTARAIAYWNAGGISLIRYSAGMPPYADSYANSKMSPSGDFFTNVLTAETTENTALLSKLDYVAYQIGVMKTANVPVLLALFHEAQPGGWFWWSKGTGAQYVALWKYAFYYLTVTKGLNNILWLMPFSSLNGVSADAAPFYPGKDYVDLAGPDYTSTDASYARIRTIVGSTMPMPLHESDTVDPNSWFSTASPWVLFNVWAGYETSRVTTLQAAYASSYTITRDEVPNLK
jgi:hypothetical protein